MDSSIQSPLKQRVMRAGIWTLAGFALSLVIRLGSNLLMTRLLAPEMFGIMAIASTLIMGLAMFSDVGLRQNIVQSKRGHEVAFLNTAWAIQILRGALLWSVALCLCGVMVIAARLHQVPADSVYASPSLPYVLAALSFSTIIAGFESTKLFEASRNILLARNIGIEIISQIAGLACMIGWVLVDRSIWALVAGSLCSTLVRTVLSHTWMYGTANSWQWDRPAAHEVLHFGKWILFSSILGFLVNSGDRLLLGGLVNSKILGLYAIASLIVGSAEGVLSKIMADVAFPALSEVVRLRAARLKKSYYRVLTVVASIAYFASGVLMTFGETLVRLLYDHRYEDAGWMLEILAAMLVTIPFRLATQSFLALGLPKLQSNVIIVRLIVLVVLTPVGFHFFGLGGAIVAIVVSHLSAVPIIVWYNIRLELFDLRKELYLALFVPVGLGIGSLLDVTLGHWK